MQEASPPPAGELALLSFAIFPPYFQWGRCSPQLHTCNFPSSGSAAVTTRTHYPVKWVMLRALLYRFDLWFHGMKVQDKPRDIVTALTALESKSSSVNYKVNYYPATCDPQLVPVVKEIGVKRLIAAKNEIFRRTKKQIVYYKELEENPKQMKGPMYWHIGYPTTIRNPHNLQAKPYVDPDILRVVAAFEEHNNCFIADENDFGFAPHVPLEVRKKIFIQIQESGSHISVTDYWG